MMVDDNAIKKALKLLIYRQWLVPFLVLDWER